MMRYKRFHHGFTLIELLATTIIAALLLLGLLSVTASLGRAVHAEPTTAIKPRWQQSLQQRIREDFLHADTWSMANGGIELTGSGWIDPVTMEYAHRQARIEYLIVRPEHTPANDAGLDAVAGWLVRRQTDLRKLMEQQTDTILLCPNVRSIRVSEPQPPEVRGSALSGLRVLPPIEGSDGNASSVEAKRAEVLELQIDFASVEDPPLRCIVFTR